MAKGPIITEEVEWLIAKVYKEHSDWPAKQIVVEVNKRLRDSNPDTPANWPGLSSVQKYLTEMRKKEDELPINPEDGLWDVLTLAKYDIPAEALPVVLEIYVQNARTTRDPLTIRQVKWIARLFHAVKDIEMLEFLAWVYATSENVNELRGEVYQDIGTDFLLYSRMTGKPLSLKLPGRAKSIKVTLENPSEFYSWKKSTKPEVSSTPPQAIGEELLIKTKEGILKKVDEEIHERLHNKKGKE